jgi:dihydroorotate dehydrogenase
LSIYRHILRPLLFSVDAEAAHNTTMALLSSPVSGPALRAMAARGDEARLSQRLFERTFENPIGLAAGLDKQGTAVAAWETLGFGFAEIGTVTPRPQPGNPRPRLFRLPADEAIINRFGFNSDGRERVAQHLRQHARTRMPLGINIGKNKETPNDRAADDYAACAAALHGDADYLAINVSSPNTAGLRELQEVRALRALVEQVVKAAAGVPVLVKFSPDMSPDDLRAAVDAAAAGGAWGIIATNTTLRRDGLRTSGAVTSETGGLSGRPLRTAANDACRLIFQHVRRMLPIIGVGGITTADDAYERVRSGASLLQVYTAFIYHGPGLLPELLDGLSARLQRDGFSQLHQAVGIDVH